LNPEIEAAFSDIAAGNKDAFDFCRSAFEFFHLFDDLVDRDHPIDPNETILCLLKFIETLTRNPFYQAHRDDLFATLTTGAFAYAASLRQAADPDVQKRVASEVLKSQYQDVFFRTAFWVGGSRHSIEMDTKYRSYSFG
jgi:hypothetical protein